MVAPAVTSHLQGKPLLEGHAADARNEGPCARVPVVFGGDLDAPVVEPKDELAVTSGDRSFDTRMDCEFPQREEQVGELRGFDQVGALRLNAAAVRHEFARDEPPLCSVDELGPVAVAEVIEQELIGLEHAGGKDAVTTAAVAPVAEVFRGGGKSEPARCDDALDLFQCAVQGLGPGRTVHSGGFRRRGPPLWTSQACWPRRHDNGPFLPASVLQGPA